MPTIGYKPTTPQANGPLITTATQDAFSTDNEMVITEPGWLTEIGVVAKTSGQVLAWLSAYKTGTNGRAGAFLGRTNRLTLTPSGGLWANFYAPIVDSRQPVKSTIRVAAGDRLWFSIAGNAGVGAQLQLGIRAGLALYDRNNTNGAPVDPFNAAVMTTVAGAPSLWATFIPNIAPNAPTGLSPADNTVSQEIAPVFSGVFSDPNTGAPTLDYLGAVEFEVTDVSGTVALWSGPTAIFTINSDITPPANLANTFAKRYNGVPLNGGDIIKWRARTSDSHGTWGDWSDVRTYTVTETGYLTQTAPAGKIDGPTDEIAWSGTYRHDEGDAASQAQIRVLLASGAVYREGNAFAVSLAANQAFTIPANADGDIGPIERGQAYSWQMRFFADGEWGPYVGDQVFRTNALPGTPVNLSPNGGAASSSRPYMTWVSQDPDPDDINGVGVEWELRVADSNDVVREVTVSTVDAGLNPYHEATNATVPTASAFPYRWQVRAKDKSASDGYSEWSDWATFYYVSGLGVAIEDPTPGEVVADASPRVTFSISSGTLLRRRVRLYNQSAPTIPIYDSEEITSNAGFHDIPPQVIQNGGAYEVEVWAINTIGGAGWSQRRKFRVEYTAPAAINSPVCSLFTSPGDPGPSSVMFSWARAAQPQGVFDAYIVTRRYVGEPFSAGVVIKKIRNVMQTVWVDYAAPADRPLIYSVQVQTRQSTGNASSMARSLPVEATIKLDLPFVVMHSTLDGSIRGIAMWKPLERSFSPKQDMALHDTWGTGGLPTAVFARGTQDIMDLSFQVISDHVGDQEENYARIENLYRQQHPTMFRDARRRFVGVFTSFSDNQQDTRDTVRARIEEIAWIEGDFS